MMEDVSEPARSGTIAVVPYNPLWPIAFDQVRATIEQTLAMMAFEVHHVGSTSVPGLCAKPKVDIDLVMHDVDDIGRAVDRFKKTDRDFQGDPYGDSMWTFTSRRSLSPGHRLYICAPNTPAHLKRMLFRDYLRSHPEMAASYGDLKRRLAVAAEGDWRAYTEGKSAFVADVVERAIATQSGNIPAMR